MHSVVSSLFSVIFLIFVLYIIGCIDTSLAATSAPCSHYPSHRIQYFIPHTITVFIFSSSPNPLLYFPDSNDFYLLSPSASSPNSRAASLSARIIQLKHHSSPIKSPPLSVDRSPLPLINSNASASICEMPSAEPQLIPFTKTIERNRIQNSLSIIALYFKNTLKSITFNANVLWSTIAIQAQNTYDHIKYYPYVATFEEMVKKVYLTISYVRRFIIEYTQEGNQFISYLEYILPSHLHHAAVQQICAILFFGCTILIMLMCIFIGLWLFYKDRINEYLNDTTVFQ